MSDPRVESCLHRAKTGSEKIRCMYPGRPYYFCKTNRRDNFCPLGLSTTYDDPEPKPERPFRSSIEESMRYFHEHHEIEERNQHEAYQRGFAEARKQERERIVKILESWNPFQTTFGEVMESLCKQHEGAPVTPQPPDQFDTYPGEYDFRPAPSPETKQPKCDDCLFRFQCTLLYFPPCERMARQDEQQAAAQAREKLFEAIRAERDPHLDYVDWDSIEAAYNRTGGDER